MPATPDTTHRHDSKPSTSTQSTPRVKSGDRLAVKPGNSPVTAQSPKPSTRKRAKTVHWDTPVATDAESKTHEEYKSMPGPSVSGSKTTHPRAASLTPSPKPMANMSAKMSYSSPKSKLPTTKYHVPPRAPDAPRIQGPPPAPRPRRLPTPDLPDIDGSWFYPPLPEAQKGVTQSKMDAQRKSPSPESADNLAAADLDSGSGESPHAEPEKDMTGFIPWEMESYVRICCVQ